MKLPKIPFFFNLLCDLFVNLVGISVVGPLLLAEQHTLLLCAN